MSLWNGAAAELDTAAYSPALAALLEAAMERVAGRRHRALTEGDLLHAALSARPDDPGAAALDPAARAELADSSALLAARLAAGVGKKDALDAFDVVADVGPEEVNPFERAAWREPLPRLVEALPPGARVADLLAGLFGATADLPDGDLVASLFDVEALMAALSLAADQASAFADGRLDAGAFTPRALFLVRQATARAARAGRECRGVDLLAAMVGQRDTYTHLVLRRLGLGPGSAKIANWLQAQGEADAPAAQARDADGAGRDGDGRFAPELAAVLDAAVKAAAQVGSPAAGERELLAALASSPAPSLAHAFRTGLDLPAAQLAELLRETPEPEIVAPQLPADLGPVRNLTLEAARPVPRPDLTARIVEVLFRKKNRNVLLHGETGVGVSTMAQVLARALRSGGFPALAQSHVILFDLAAAPPEEYTHTVERVLAHMDSEPGRIYVLEGFAPYFQEHFAATARRFAHTAYGLILIVDTAERTALGQGPALLNSFLEVVEVPEPGRDLADQMLRQAQARVEAEYSVRFGPAALAAATRMASDYMISQRFPAKAVDLLERAATDVAAAAAMAGRAPQEIGRAQIARRVAVLTGLPQETILGTGADKDYVDLLSRNLVGQEVAVAKAAGRLDLIQKGMVDKTAPAAVFVFAGLSGTGKTELAKQIAQLYSSSRSIIHFAMENFTEAHSVSGLIGTPPGYVGYDEGGALINALNRDPYSVVLLDEVEKAHPTVWDPFLNLFDEGSITDTRGVTASGSKAFFVMTSNIGQYEIADMLARGASQEEIEDVVMKLLPAFQHPMARQPCFRPEFVGRIVRRGGIVAFNALSQEALRGIAGRLFSKVAKDYGEVHDSKLVCDDDVLDMIARTIHEENEAVIRSHQAGYLGARRLSMLMDQHVTNKLAARLRQLAGAPLVRVVWDGAATELLPVYEEADAEALLAERRLALVARVERRFNQLLTAPDDAFARLDDSQLARVDRLLAEVGAVL